MLLEFHKKNDKFANIYFRFYEKKFTMVWKQNPKEIKAVQCNHSIDYQKNMQWDMQQGYLQIYKINFRHRITQTVPEKWRTRKDHLILNLPLSWLFIRKINFIRNHIITSCIESKRITTNLTNPCFILATFRVCFFSLFSSLMMNKLSYKYCNKRITTRDNGDVQSHDKEESRLNSTITANSGAHTLTHD